MQITGVRTLTQALAAPVLQASVTGTTSTLTWAAPVTSGQSVIAGYRLRRSALSSGPYTLLQDATLTSFSEVLPSGTYFYTIEAYDQFQTGRVSSAKSVVISSSSGAPVIKSAGFGHYLCDTSFGDDFDTNLTIAQGLLAGIVGTSVKGYAIGFKCAQYNQGTSSPNYAAGRTWLKAVLDLFGAAGKYVIPFTMDRTFGSNGTIPANTYPPYWVSNGWVVAVPSGAGNSGPVQSLVANWIPGAYNEYFAMWSDIMAIADPHPACSLVMPWGETSMAATVPTFGNSSSSANYGTWLRNYVLFLQQLNALFPHTPLRFQLNDTGGYADTTAAGSWTLLNMIVPTPAIYCGGPDSETEGPTQASIAHLINGWNSYRGQPGNFTPGQPGSVDCFPRLGFCAESQAGATLTTASTPANMFAWSQSYVHEQFRIWGTYSGFANFTKSKLIAFINANPGTNATPPTNGNYVSSSLTAVQNVLLLLTGQTAVNQSVVNPAGWFFNPASPNFNRLGWDALTGATSYEVWRETSRNGTWVLMGTTTGLTYDDTTATNTASGTPGSGPQFFTCTTYRYKVRGVNAGGAGAFSTSYSAILYRNGSYNPATPNSSTGFINGDFGSAGTPDYQNTSGGYPNGEKCILFSPTNDFPDWNYDVGTSCPQWSFWVGPFDTLQYDIKPLFAGAAFTMGWYRRSSISGGDQPLVTATGAVTQYNVNDFNPVPIANSWNFGVSMPIPILDQDAPAGIVVAQDMHYKNNHQLQAVNSGQKWYVNNLRVTTLI